MPNGINSNKYLQRSISSLYVWWLHSCPTCDWLNSFFFSFFPFICFAIFPKLAGGTKFSLFICTNQNRIGGQVVHLAWVYDSESTYHPHHHTHTLPTKAKGKGYCKQSQIQNINILKKIRKYFSLVLNI